MAKDKNKVREYNKWYYAQNREREKERVRQYNLNNPEKVKIWRGNVDKVKKNAQTKLWRERNKEHLREYNRQYKKKYCSENSEKLRELKRNSYYKNIETYKAYRKRNSTRIATHNRKRELLQISRVPKSANFESIVRIYEDAKRISEETGVPHDVDHIVPLQGKLVAGFHAEWNLRIITSSENRKKHNKFTPEVKFAG